jgi:hypothetical protein
MNQIQMGPPPSGMPNVLKPVQDAVQGGLDKLRSRSSDFGMMASHHALTSMRMDQSHNQNKEMETLKHGNATELQTSRLTAQAAMQTEKLGAAAKESNAQRRHGLRTIREQNAHAQGTQAADIAHQQALRAMDQGHAANMLNATMAGVGKMGRAGHIAEFKMGDVSAKFRETQRAATEPVTQAPAPEAPQATAAPAPTPSAPRTEAFVPKMVQGPGGKFMKNPDHPDNKGMAPAPVAKKAAVKKAAARPRKKK